MDLGPRACRATSTIGVSARAVAVVCPQCRTHGPEAPDSNRAIERWNNQPTTECIACGGAVAAVPCGVKAPCPHCGWCYPRGSCTD